MTQSEVVAESQNLLFAYDCSGLWFFQRYFTTPEADFPGERSQSEDSAVPSAVTRPPRLPLAFSHVPSVSSHD